MNVPVFSLSKSITIAKCIFLCHFWTNDIHCASQIRDSQPRPQAGKFMVTAGERDQEKVGGYPSKLFGGYKVSRTRLSQGFCTIKAATSWNETIITKTDSWLFNRLAPNPRSSAIPLNLHITFHRVQLALTWHGCSHVCTNNASRLLALPSTTSAPNQCSQLCAVRVTPSFKAPLSRVNRWLVCIRF